MPIPSKVPKCGKYRGIEGGCRMLIFCAECGRYIGEVRPFWDRSISERMCEECHEESEKIDIEEMRIISDSQKIKGSD